MKFLFDLAPVLAFFIAFKLADIYVATAVAIVDLHMQVAWLKLRGKRVDADALGEPRHHRGLRRRHAPAPGRDLHQVEADGALLAARAVLGGAALVFRRNLVRAMLSEQVRLPDPVWNRLNWSWVGFFAFMGALNLYVAYNFSTDLWVNFKLFGGMGLMLVFVVAQAFVLARHVEDKQ